MPVNSTTNNQYIYHKTYEYNTNQIKIFGFWIYLMSDLILFACLFATYGVLINSTADGPKGKDIFNLNFVLIQTFLLLFSNITYGFVMLAMHKQKINIVNLWLLITFLLGLSFIIMEIYEFYELNDKSYSPGNSAFLSAFFTLISTHGIHVIFGLTWIIVMIIHVLRNGLNIINQTRLNCLSLFWHFLDLLWICIFTIVYLLGTIG